MIHKPLIIFLLTSLLNNAWIGAQAEEYTSENGDRLKRFYERFPKADLDKNGVMTLDEMHDYLDSKIKDGATSEKGANKKQRRKGSFKNLSSRVYLTVFLQESPETDLNKDGILTKVELLEFVKLKKLDRPGEDKKVAGTAN